MKWIERDESLLQRLIYWILLCIPDGVQVLLRPPPELHHELPPQRLRAPSTRTVPNLLSLSGTSLLIWTAKLATPNIGMRNIGTEKSWKQNRQASCVAGTKSQIRKNYPWVVVWKQTHLAPDWSEFFESN